MIALSVSVLLHLAVLAELPRQPAPREATTVLIARLLPGMAQTKPPPPAPERRPTRHEHAPPSPPPASAATTPETPAAEAPPAATPSPEAPHDTRAPEPEAPVAEPEAPVAEPEEPVAEPEAPVAKPEPVAPAAPAAALPQRLVLTYTLYKGEQGLAVGELTHEWQSRDGEYVLTSMARATGPFSLFVRGTLIQVSHGRIGTEGLEPREFWIQRGDATRTERAVFDWGTGSLRLGPANDLESVPLAPGTQDVLSVFYTLALTAPHRGTLVLPVTNGRKLDRYSLTVVGEETVDTPQGPVTAVHLARVAAPDEDGLELWLAEPQGWLPVRIRFVDRKGGVAEARLKAPSPTGPPSPTAPEE